MRRRTLATVLLLAAAAVQPAHAATDPTVHVTVGLTSFGYDDTSAPATYAITCGTGWCPRPRASNDVDTARHTIRRPRLGFAATRTSTAVGLPSDLSTGVQQESVVVTMTKPGDLDVTLTGRQNAAVDAAPVAGTPSKGGTITGRAVHWHLRNAHGTTTFSAQFRVTADRTKVGSYTTAATVTRTERTATLFDYAWGSQRVARPVRRVSTAAFAERIAPPYGTPHGAVTPWAGVPGFSGVKDEFAGSTALDAYGAYDATASGTVGAKILLNVRQFLPRGVDLSTLSLGIGTSWASAGFEPKFDPGMSFEWDEADRLTGLGFATCANGGIPGATLYDRDTSTLTGLADFTVLTAKRTGGPANDRGRLRSVWSGAMSSGWYEWATRSALDVGGSPRFSGWLHGANIHVLVTGGDIDNRDGDYAVVGTPAVLHVPAGERIADMLVATPVLEHTEFDLDLQVDASRGTATLRPEVGPAGYWLRAGGHGFARDWATAMSVLVNTEPADGSGSAAPGIATIRIVPPGTRALVRALARDGTVRSALLDPGIWSITSTATALRAVPLVPNDPSACDGL